MKYCFLFLFVCTACSIAPQKNSIEKNQFLVLTTDFGTKDGAVSEMKGVAYTAAPQLVISDLTHDIPPFNIWEAAFRLDQTYRYWPPGTVFVTVVDPGVGSERKPVVAKTKSGFYFVGPDNGHLTLLKEDIERVRAIDEKTQRRQGSETSYTFHGRDLFVLVGARLASGQISFEQVGPELNQSLTQLPYQKAELVGGEIHGQIPVLDPNYGNVWTNISRGYFLSAFPKEKKFYVSIEHKGKSVFSSLIPLVQTFSAVPKGRPLLYFNSLLNLSLALNQDSFATKYRIGSGPEWQIRIRPQRGE